MPLNAAIRLNIAVFEIVPMLSYQSVGVATVVIDEIPSLALPSVCGTAIGLLLSIGLEPLSFSFVG